MTALPQTFLAVLRLFLPLLIAASAFAAASPPLEVTIRTPAAQMKYDRTEFLAEPGQTVRLSLTNEDEMPHNLVVCRPKAGGKDQGLEVAMAAWELAEKGPDLHWIPKHARVLAHTQMVMPHQTGTVTFTAPKEPGDYPYVCTFPGHATMMNGMMRVEPRTRLTNLHYRAYRGPFKELPDFGQLGSRALGEGMMDDGLIDAKVVEAGPSYALEFEGQLEAQAAGKYTFTVAGDRGPQLLIDGEMKLDFTQSKNWRSYKAVQVPLAKGPHRVVVRYWHHGNTEPQVTLTWSGPGFRDHPLSKVDLVSQRRQEQAESFVGLPLIPKDGEAILYRNFLADVMPSGFAVGYPEGVSVEWDPQKMNVGALWIGSFLDAKRHWTGRGGGEVKPSGYAVLRPSSGPALALLAAPDAPWPKAEASRFFGYSLDAQRRPTFRYQTGGVEVEESFLPAGSLKTHDLSLTRTLRLKAKNGTPAKLMLRLLTGNFVESPEGLVVNQEVRASAVEKPLLRGEGSAREALVPARFQGGQAILSVTYAWIGHYH